jgi:thymidylate synthase
MIYAEMNAAYPALIDKALEEGELFEPRGYKCLELRPYSFTMADPTKTIYQGVSRKLNARFFAIETLSYIAGLGSEPWHADLMVMANQGMAAFRNEDSGLFDGAYGPRIKKSIGDVIELLKRDKDSRQAVCSIWSPGIPKSKDVPCTVCLHFFRKKGKLEMHVYMRSNDLNWGLPYDVPAFAAIQLHVADRLGWEAGSYHHTAGSLHVYLNERDEKGQPGPPRLDLENERYEVRRVPVVGDPSWIEPALRHAWEIQKEHDCWTDFAGMGVPEPWRSMIANKTWYESA